MTIFFNFFQKSNSIKNLKNNIDKSLLLIYNNLRCLNKAAEQNKMQKWRNWQTRTVQVRVVVIPCGFDSHLLQAENRNFQYGDSCFYVHFSAADRPSTRQSGTAGTSGPSPVLLRPSGRPPFLPLLPIFVPRLPLRPSFYESRQLPPIPHPVQEHRDMWFCAQSMWGQVSPVPAFPVGFSAVLTSVWRHARSSP